MGEDGAAVPSSNALGGSRRRDRAVRRPAVRVDDDPMRAPNSGVRRGCRDARATQDEPHHL